MNSNNNFFIKNIYNQKKIDKKNYFVDENKIIEESKIWQVPAYNYCKKFISKNISKIEKVIDFGSGYGFKTKDLAEKFRNINFLGIDQLEKERNLKKENLSFIKRNLEKKINKMDNLVDLAICIDVIEHLNNPNSLIYSILNNLKTAGHLIISTPDRDRCRGKNSNTIGKHHAREWNNEEFKEYLGQFKNFEIIEDKHLLPYKIGLNKIFFSEFKYRFLRRPLKYNQIFLLQKI